VDRKQEKGDKVANMASNRTIITGLGLVYYYIVVYENNK